MAAASPAHNAEIAQAIDNQNVGRRNLNPVKDYYPLSFYYLPTVAFVTLCLAISEIIYARNQLPLLLHGVHLLWCSLILTGLLVSTLSNWKYDRNSRLAPTLLMEFVYQAFGIVGLFVITFFLYRAVRGFFQFDMTPHTVTYFAIALPSIIVNFLNVAHLFLGSGILIQKSFSNPGRRFNAEEIREVDLRYAAENSFHFLQNIIMAISFIVSGYFHNNSYRLADIFCTAGMCVIFCSGVAIALTDGLRRWKRRESLADGSRAVFTSRLNANNLLRS